jgi:hypothetical protein
VSLNPLVSRRLVIDAHAALAGDASSMDVARCQHAQAVELRDPVATALWARVLWRRLGRQPEHAWLHATVGCGVGDDAPTSATMLRDQSGSQ